MVSDPLSRAQRGQAGEIGKALGVVGGDEVSLEVEENEEATSSAHGRAMWPRSADSLKKDLPQRRQGRKGTHRIRVKGYGGTPE